MHIVIYTTNSNRTDLNNMSVTSLPACGSQLDALCSSFPECTFTLVIQKPGMFLLDEDEKNCCRSVRYIFADEAHDSVQDIAGLIEMQNPDLAVAMTYWVAPFDWLSIKDSLIGEELVRRGIKTICHPAESSLICFDKTRTRDFLKNNGFNIAESVYVHHELFYAERNRPDVKTNVYKEYVFEKIKNLKLPLVVKDTTGLSSYGMDVCTTFAEVRHVLTSKKNNGDRLVEEFLNGPSFGAEIYGYRGNYQVSEVLINSVNQFGLTSPKQNVKLGPVVSEKYRIPELKQELIRLAECLELNGIAQVDLLFSEGVWYIIEINSRLSGMTQTLAASYGKNVHQLLVETATGRLMLKKPSFILNMKFPLLSEEYLHKLKDLPFVFYVNQIENHNAKQIRELGYAEVIFGGTESLAELMKQLEIIKNTFPDKIENVFYENAKKLASQI